MGGAYPLGVEPLQRRLTVLPLPEGRDTLVGYTFRSGSEAVCREMRVYVCVKSGSSLFKQFTELRREGERRG